MSGADRSAWDALRHEVERGGARPHAIDTLIGRLPDRRDAGATAALLSLLSDRAPDDEGMFSILHAAEAADDATYVAGLLESVETLATAAPRWASIVLMRVLNHEGSRDALVRQVRAAPVAVKEAVRSLAERIDAASPEFRNRTAPVILAAG